MASLKGQVAWITGAAGGFGQSLSKLLLREGCALVLADRQRPALEEAAATIAQAAPKAKGQILGLATADLSTPAGAQALYDTATAISERVDMLVNNAGIGMHGRFDQVPSAKWEALMQVNLLAPMRLTQLVLPQLIERRSGHIVNISSAAGLMGARGLAVYNASKFGLRGFSEALAQDVKRYNIGVTTLYPFFSRTPILNSEHFGDLRPFNLPERLISNPDDIMAALVRGIKRRKLHVYPDRMARRIHFLRRLAG